LSLSLTSGAGPLQGNTNLDIGTAAANGTGAFTNLRIDSLGTNKQLTAAAPGLNSVVSSLFSVTAAAADHLTIQTQPSATAIAGAAFATQPVIRIEDAFGNLVTSDNGRVITASKASGSAALQGTVTASTVNGVATFSNLAYTVAETISINFDAGSLTGTLSSNVVINPGAAGRLVIQTQPSASAVAGVGFEQQPIVRVEDQYGNWRSADNSTVVTAVRNSGSGALQGGTTLTVSGGLVSFANLSHTVATNITI